MATGLRERLKAAIETAEIELPDGTTFTVRGLTGQERAEFAELVSDMDEDDTDLLRAAEIQAWIATRGIVGEDGEREYGDDETDEAKALPAKILDAAARTIMELSRMTEESAEEGKGDSAPTARNVGGGASPSTSDTKA